ncbi:MAG: HAMP domain-containing sensor histidine kinase [Elusimicrobia bacterium]|nr:HAMP domain-containing sensor histidine kinase [Elusimicrobiota bacterium]
MIKKPKNSDSTQSSLVHHMLHELKTPLTILKGEISLVLKNNNSPRNYKSVLISSMEEVNRISVIVENLTTLMKYENNEIILQKKIIDMNLVIKSVLDDTKILLKQKNIKIKLLSKPKIFLEGDEKQLKVLFANLLRSIIKYTPEKGNILLNLSKKAKYTIVQITGTDITGSAGIENFYLSLKLPEYIVKAHNGKIKIKKESTHPKTLIVYIPLSF